MNEHEPVDGAQPGHAIIVASWIATLGFAATAIPTMVPISAFDALSVTVALVLFAVSIPLWLVAFVAGVNRSRTEIVTISGLFFLRAAAPRVERRLLLGSFAATLAVTAATASAEPFGVLVPVLPLAFAGLWGARHGTFPPRPVPPPRTKRRAPPAASPADAARPADPPH